MFVYIVIALVYQKLSYYYILYNIFPCDMVRIQSDQESSSYNGNIGNDTEKV